MTLQFIFARFAGLEEAQGGISGFDDNTFESRFALFNINSGQGVLPVINE